MLSIRINKPTYRLSAVTAAYILVLSVALSSCSQTDYYDDEPGLRTETLDSYRTELQLDNIINGGYLAIGKFEKYCYPELRKRDDLRYLPYLYIVLSERYLPLEIAQKYYYMVVDMCRFSSDDSVYNIGKLLSDRLKKRYAKLSGPASEAKWGYPYRTYRFKQYATKVQIEDKTYNLDSLRVRVIGYNDRNALSLLEKYYSNSGSMKELAVYYKIMLGFEGNGDLADRYYKALKPYIAEQPEFLNDIRKTLLRAALCDLNDRAQQLCDSLGFSLCDYRLPKLGQLKY